MDDRAALWADKVINNRKPAHTKKNAPLKAEVIRQAAEKLKELGYTTRDHLHGAYAEDNELQELKYAWEHLPSQRSGVTYNYLLILAGFQSVKPDRMVIRFIKDNAELGDRDLTTSEAADLIKQVAELYPTEARRLDHVIWRYVSGREVFREELESDEDYRRQPVGLERPRETLNKLSLLTYASGNELGIDAWLLANDGVRDLH